jgi:hypothetical protein
MLTKMFNRSKQTEDKRVSEVDVIKAKLRDFGETGSNPVRDQIADLRSLRAAGRLTETDYAVTVAALLGTIDATTNYPAGTSLDLRFRAAQ